MTATNFFVILAIFAVLSVCQDPGNRPYLATEASLDNWLATTAANVKFTGSAFSNPLVPQHVRLIYCTEYDEISNTCGGQCIAYQGPGSQCMKSSIGTVNCLASTQPLDMCYLNNCSNCNYYDWCGVKLENGFCYTPQTNSMRLWDYAGSFARTSLKGPTPSISPSPVASAGARPASAASNMPESQASSTPPATDTSRAQTTFVSSTILSSSSRDIRSSSSNISSTVDKIANPVHPTSSPNQTSPPKPAMRLPIGGILGLAVGLLLLFAVPVFCICSRRRQKAKRARKTKALLAEPFPVTGWSVSGARTSVQYLGKSPRSLTTHFSGVDSDTPSSSRGLVSFGGSFRGVLVSTPVADASPPPYST